MVYRPNKLKLFSQKYFKETYCRLLIRPALERDSASSDEIDSHKKCNTTL